MKPTLMHCPKNDQYYVQVLEPAYFTLAKKIKRIQKYRDSLCGKQPEKYQALGEQCHILREQRNKCQWYICVDAKLIPENAHIRQHPSIPNHVLIVPVDRQKFYLAQVRSVPAAEDGSPDKASIAQ